MTRPDETAEPSRSRGPILEANVSQTVASASTALATGTIFTGMAAGSPERPPL